MKFFKFRIFYIKKILMESHPRLENLQRSGVQLSERLAPLASWEPRETPRTSQHYGIEGLKAGPYHVWSGLILQAVVWAAGGHRAPWKPRHITAVWYRGVQEGPQWKFHYAERLQSLRRQMIRNYVTRVIFCYHNWNKFFYHNSK